MRNRNSWPSWPVFLQVWGASMNDLVYYAIVAIILLVVLYAAMFGLKMLQNRARRNRQGRRIGIVEMLDVDERRQLVLVRRDDVEHLLLVGGDSDLVVEDGIQRQAPVAPAAEGEPGAPPVTEPRRRMPFAPRRPTPPPPPPVEEPPPHVAPHEPEPVPPRGGEPMPHEPRIAPPPGPVRD